MGRANSFSESKKQALYYISGSIVQHLLKENTLCEKCMQLLEAKLNASKFMRYESGSAPESPAPPEFFLI